jgi:hypothetical protein
MGYRVTKRLRLNQNCKTQRSIGGKNEPLEKRLGAILFVSKGLKTNKDAKDKKGKADEKTSERNQSFEDSLKKVSTIITGWILLTQLITAIDSTMKRTKPPMGKYDMDNSIREQISAKTLVLFDLMKKLKTKIDLTTVDELFREIAVVNSMFHTWNIQAGFALSVATLEDKNGVLLQNLSKTTEFNQYMSHTLSNGPATQENYDIVSGKVKPGDDKGKGKEGQTEGEGKTGEGKTGEGKKAENCPEDYPENIDVLEGDHFKVVSTEMKHANNVKLNFTNDFEGYFKESGYMGKTQYYHFDYKIVFAEPGKPRKYVLTFTFSPKGQVSDKYMIPVIHEHFGFFNKKYRCEIFGMDPEGKTFENRPNKMVFEFFNSEKHIRVNCENPVESAEAIGLNARDLSKKYAVFSDSPENACEAALQGKIEKDKEDNVTTITDIVNYLTHDLNINSKYWEAVFYEFRQQFGKMAKDGLLFTKQNNKYITPSPELKPHRYLANQLVNGINSTKEKIAYWTSKEITVKKPIYFVLGDKKTRVINSNTLCNNNCKPEDYGDFKKQHSEPKECEKSKNTFFGIKFPSMK